MALKSLHHTKSFRKFIDVIHEERKSRWKIKSLAAHAKVKLYLKRIIFKQDNGKDRKDKTMI